MKLHIDVDELELVSNQRLIDLSNISTDYSWNNSKVLTDFSQTSINGFNFYGTAGKDIISGSQNIDTISGGAGNDIISGGAGIDSLKGNEGADIFILDQLAETSIDYILDFTAGEDGDIISLDLSQIGSQVIDFKGNALTENDDPFISYYSVGLNGDGSSTALFQHNIIVWMDLFPIQMML